MLPLHLHFFLLFLTLPSWMISLVLPAVLPFVSSSAAVYLHALVTKGENWYATSAPHALQLAIAVVVGLGITAAGAAISGLPGGALAVSSCSGAATSGALSSDCMSALLGLMSSPVLQVLLTAILTGAGVLAVKTGRIHDVAIAQYRVTASMAQKAGISSPSLRAL